MRKKRALFLAVVPFLLFALEAAARVGGGHSYSGGGGGGGGGYGGGYGGHYSSSGGGNVGQLIFEVLRGFYYLTVYYPVIGIPIDLIVLFAIYKFLTSDHETYIRSAEEVSGLSSFRSPERVNIPERFRQLRDMDPEFSRALFNDFCYALYPEVHKARVGHQLLDFVAYVSPQAADALARVGPAAKKIEGIIVGAMTVERVSLSGPQTEVVVRFEANYTESSSTGQKQSWYANERWTFVRAREARSRPPETIRQFTCPSCGAPPANDGQNRCPSCGNSNAQGRLGWQVSAHNGTREERPPLLTETVEEVGTNFPTLYDPELKTAEPDLIKAQPDFNWQTFDKRATTIFLELQKAWSDRRWERARPFETDAVFQTHAYWMNEYAKQGLQNRLSNVQITRVVPAKIDEDKFYSSITLRIFASMVDQTISTQNSTVVCGSSSPRAFSEYWTFIRGRGTGARAKARAANGNDLACPSCGAALDKVNAAGVCEYCGAKITSGEFDWVLSMIEQDEAYSG